MVGDGQKAWQMLLRTDPRRRPGGLGGRGLVLEQSGQKTFVDVFRKDSNIAVVIADIAGQALDIFLHGPESAHKNGFVKTFTHTSIPIHPCTHS